MHPLIEQARSELTELCRRHHVQRLELFGSAATGRFDEGTSDFDFLVEFQPRSPDDPHVYYFDLKDGLENLLHRPVDLVDLSAVRNPYFLQAIESSRHLLYAP